MAKDKETPTAPRIDVYERRIQNPFGEPSASVRLKNQAFEPRWFNSASRTDQFYRAKELGWEGVRPDDVEDLGQIGIYTVSPDGYITRGPRGEELLMRMPGDVRQKIQLAKERHNYNQVRDFASQKRNLLDAMAKTLGSEAAEQANEGIVGGSGRVKMMKERIVVEQGES